jgi:hypothetical protein
MWNAEVAEASQGLKTKGNPMPIKEVINLVFVIVTGIAVTHPMTFAVELRRIELSILREASDTRSWGDPVHFPEHEFPHKFGRPERAIVSKSR